MKRIPSKPTSVLPTRENTYFKPLSEVVVVPERTVVLEDMLTVAWTEVGRLKAKQKNGLTLDAKEVRTLTGLIDAVTKLSKEQRESEKQFDAGNLSDEEYLEELGKAYDALEQKIKASKAKEGNDESQGKSK